MSAAVELALYHAAPASADPRAPVAIYLHGFPDHPPTAHAFLAALATRYRVIAPYLRGYAPSPCPRTGYDLATLADDVIALAARVSPDAPIDLIGHDWGAAIAYVVAERAPARIRRVVTLAVPHPFTLIRTLQRSSAQRWASRYMLGVQVPRPRWAVGPTVDRLWRRWSPDYVLPDSARAALHATLAASWPAPTRYYTAFVRRPPPRAPAPIAAPVLQLHGARDGCIYPPGDDDGHRFRARTYACMPNLGHFLHVEDPQGIAARALAFLAP